MRLLFACAGFPTGEVLGQKSFGFSFDFLLRVDFVGPGFAGGGSPGGGVDADTALVGDGDEVGGVGEGGGDGFDRGGGGVGVRGGVGGGLALGGGHEAEGGEGFAWFCELLGWC